MSTPVPIALSANFNEPASDDTTSAPALQIPQQPRPQAQQAPQGKAQGLAQALAQKKRKGIGPAIKAPSSLAAAISKAKRARQGGDKYG